MVSLAKRDESRRLERLMAELRDLPSSAAFKKLSVEEQKRIASALRDLAAKVRTLKAEPVSTQGQAQSTALAKELRPEDQQRRLPAVSQKSEFGTLVEQVDFPTFVGELVKGTFNAIVDGSIQQMEAYGKLLSEVATKIGEGCKPGC
jgi:hypothetical protein